MKSIRQIFLCVLFPLGMSTSIGVGAEDRTDDPFANAIKGLIFNVLEQELKKTETSESSRPSEPSTNFNQRQPSESDVSLRVLDKQVQAGRATVQGRVIGLTFPTNVYVGTRTLTTDSSGFFSYETFIPVGLSTFVFTVRDANGTPVSEIVNLERGDREGGTALQYATLNPSARQATVNENAVALIVGIAQYSNVAEAAFADRDAQVFYEYAHQALGIPQKRIQMLVNSDADFVGLLSGIDKWLKRAVQPGLSDVYVFFAGHGLASDDGETAYLVPHDGAPDFLTRTAISRDEVFQGIASVNPRSVTVFLDTCYSGDTRGEQRLIAGRPLAIKLKEQRLPAGFTVLTAAGADQIAKPLEEAQHGMFSYYLMKGMEGDADLNNDSAITAKELHAFIKQNVIQQSNGSQVPELQGDDTKVLVRLR